jgi:hypothetical protein
MTEKVVIVKSTEEEANADAEILEKAGCKTRVESFFDNGIEKFAVFSNGKIVTRTEVEKF